MERIGFIGLGAMGHGMAANVLAKHGQLTILGNRDRTPVEGLVSKGAEEAQDAADLADKSDARSEEHTSELQSRPHISYAVFCLKKKKTTPHPPPPPPNN